MVPAGRNLVSVTDARGRITYCNEAFIEVSGYSRDELLGRAHNIVRHPDMPEEAFRDMWATIQSGVSWTAVVKNRRKDGGFYWVLANAAPMMEGGRISGFLSVRVPAPRDGVNAAEHLYARMRDHQASRGVRIDCLERGQPYRNTVGGRLRRRLVPGIRGQLLLIQLAFGVMVAAAAGSYAPAGWALAAVLALAASWAMSWLTVATLDDIVSDADRLAAGDLAHRIQTGAGGAGGRLQKALNQLALNLRRASSMTPGSRCGG